MQTENNTYVNVKTVSNDLESCGGTSEMISPRSKF
jgi:hypothetical protein